MIGCYRAFTAEVNIPALFSAQLRVSGISIGSRVDQEDMIRAIDVNRLKPVIDRSFGSSRSPPHSSITKRKATSERSA